MNSPSRKVERAAKKRPLHRQLLRSHLSVALVGIIILLAALISTYELRNRVVLLASEGAPLAQSSLRVLAGVQYSMASLRGWVSLGDPHFLQDWRQAWDQEIQPAVVTLTQCQRLSAQTCILERLQELQALLAELRDVQQRVQDAVTPDPFPQAVAEPVDPLALQRMTLEADPLADRVIALATALVAEAEARFVRDAAAAQFATIATISILITTALAMLIVAYLMSRNRARSLARPIAALADATRRLEGGYPTDDLPIRRNDELGELTRAFNHMRATIQQAQAELREANALLEKRVIERTTQLAMTNASLIQEIEFRNQTEKALRESEVRIRAMTRAIPDLVFVVDAAGRYREVLAAGREWETHRITPIQGRFTAEAQLHETRQRREFLSGSRTSVASGIIPIRGKLLSEVHSSEMAEFLLGIIHRALETRQIQVAEYELATTSGLRWFESRTAPLDLPLVDQRSAIINRAQLSLFELPEGPPVEKLAAIVVARDITNRKQAETQLRQAQKMQAIGQLTGGIAHDFNNLLAVIMGNLELLHEQLVVHPRLYELALQALRAVDRGAALTRRLLVFARRQPLQAQPTDLNKLVLGMIELIRRTLGATIQIQTVLAPDLEQTCIDSDQFESTLLNLVINARDAMPQAGRLVLETTNATLDEDYAATHQDVRPGAYVVLTVSDSGAGMAPEVLERAFEPFFTTKETSKGSGLGLSMVYGLVKQSGGHVTIYSEPGRGTTVRLYLPRIHAETQATLEPPIANPSFEGHGEKILVVEDDVDVCLFAVKALHSLGYETCQAGDAKTALEILDTTPHIALLFTDIVLPGDRDGVHLATEVVRRRPGLPILFTSGYTEHMLVSGGELVEGMEMLAKPYRKAELAGKLRTLLNRRKS
ncbi:MAG TPA: ATP-binding protein [Candidatus Competibacteraceae bacterium]|nr:ATP-binding protein [Candidatus Competibacteraceae bacterium]HRZ06479.1 ATP-binding protein [Candidatus Competibacteraceae bacterium]